MPALSQSSDTRTSRLGARQVGERSVQASLSIACEAPPLGSIALR